MKYRHELKFFVNFHQYYTLRQRLKNLMEQDEHVGPTGEYHIRSLYFDDIGNKALAEKLGGISQRKKYRIRIYNLEDKVIHFEKKIKNGDYIAKVKESLTREMTDNILAGDYQGLKNPSNPFLLELHNEMAHKLLRPKVIVDYVREPYIQPQGNVRITFDKDLKSGLQRTDVFNQELSMVRALSENHIILEVKYDEYLPSPIRNVLQLEGLQRQSASKYVICRKYIKLNSWEDQ
ncbi:polyphosphate polymerase domain-containing protein [Desulfosporosinus shakirovi]|uniref:polyphosphate polymerase domain-containing protein n=1 Tax=Desulfosporosinus shakirovi TaxID=2885154 RepID=UPI00289B7B37|nr:polyphosphate polymerase domain-containing protein [Desulfosporosinus sp. SRJS8]MCB8815282.1 polyphosphate polymerase domain-containing protein [Desulfosporosinus sp. SRJS8]